MMLHQLGNKSNNAKANNRSNDLFAPTTKTTYKVLNKQARIIDDCIRSYDFDVHLDELGNGSEISTGAIFIKGDRNTSILKGRILKCGLPVNLSDITVTANVKESRAKTTVPVDVIDVNGIIQFNLPTSIVDESGINTFELVFQSGEKVVVSRTYSYTVLTSLGEGTFGSNADKTVLQSLIEEVQSSKSMVDNVIEESKDTLEDTLQEFKNTLDEVIQESSDTLDNALQDMSNNVEDYKGNIDNTLDELSNTLDNTLQEFENEIDNTLQETNNRVGNIILGFENEIEGVIQESRVEIDVTLQESRETIQETKDTINTIVEELEITQSDIDDIMAMVGDL